MPKEFIYNVYYAKQDACFPPTGDFQRNAGVDGNVVGEAGLPSDGGLTGRGCLIAVFDSGIDYTLPDFRESMSGTNELLGSRILYLWDQTLAPDPERGFYPPEGFAIGVEFDREAIDAALAANTDTERFRLVPSRDVTGHGTAVTAIAAGSNPNARYTGAAPGASLLIVKLGQAGSGAWPRTTQLMRAFAYALRTAQELGMPLAVNLSFGNSYGSHEPYN